LLVKQWRGPRTGLRTVDSVGRSGRICGFELEGLILSTFSFVVFDFVYSRCVLKIDFRDV
jgi:hypothetical protein